MKVVDIFARVSEISGYGETLLRDRSRTKALARARTFFSLIARAYGYSYPDIGHMIDRDHTTIMHCVTHNADWMVIRWLEKLSDPNVNNYVDAIRIGNVRVYNLSPSRV